MKKIQQSVYNLTLGESRGLREASVLVMDMSLELFKSGTRDDEAKRLRSLAIDLQQKARERHPGSSSEVEIVEDE